MKRTIKLWEIALLIGCLLTLLFGNLFQAEKTVSDLQQHVLRMHILANSDSDADQQLKYQVRDALLASSETLSVAVSQKVGRHWKPLQKPTCMKWKRLHNRSCRSRDIPIQSKPSW